MPNRGTIINFGSLSKKGRVLAVAAFFAVIFVVTGILYFGRTEPTMEKTRRIPPADEITVLSANSPASLSPDKITGNGNMAMGAGDTADAAAYKPDEIIVKLKDAGKNGKKEKQTTKARELAARHDMKIKKETSQKNIFVLRAEGERADLAGIIGSLRRDDTVEYAQPNYKYEPLLIDTNDVYGDNLWGLDNYGQPIEGVTGAVDADIDAPEAWAVSEGAGNDVIVAVIDTGLAYNHPDFTGNLWDGDNCLDENGDFLGGCIHGYDYQHNDKSPLPTGPASPSHGTHVAGTIAAAKNNGYGIIGVAPHAKIMGLQTALYTDEIVDSIAFAGHNGARVINASWGGTYFDQTIYDAIADFPGLFVAAAGNDAVDNDDDPHYPCAYGLANVLCVAATDYNDGLAYFSNYGLVSVDVGAPGRRIYSTVADEIVAAEDFDASVPPALPAGWVHDGNWGTFDTATSGQAIVLYGDLARFPYTASTSAYAVSPAIGLADTTLPTFGFYAVCDTAYSLYDWYDYMSLYFSGDGQSYVWQFSFDEFVLDYMAGEDPYDDEGTAAYRFSGLSINSAYRTANFHYRFEWLTDQVDNNYGGCYVDDIEIRQLGDGSGESYEYYDGTSMAAPHVAGLAALILGYNPNLSVAQLKQAITQTGDDLASLSGKTVTGKRINAHAALDIFRPYAGYMATNTIPADQISQAADGSGDITVNFRLQDTIPGLPVTLEDFHYSANGGTDWYAPANGDASASLAGGWPDGNYLTHTDFSSSTFSFVFNAKHGDVAGLSGTEQDDIRIRFRAHDGATTSPFVVTENFTIDFIGPDAPSVTAPTSTLILAADNIIITGAAATGSLVKIYNGTSTVGSRQLSATSSDFSVTAVLEQNATNTLFVVAADNLGNESAAASVPEIYEDSAPVTPLVVSVAEDLSAPFYTASSAPKIVVSGENGMDCRWSTSSLASYAEMTAGCDISGNTAACWTDDLGEDGEKTVYIGCRDYLGNEPTAFETLAVVFGLDLLPPSVASATASPSPAIAGDIDITVVFYDTSAMDTSVSPTVTVTGLATDSYAVAQTGYENKTWAGVFTLLDRNETATATITVAGATDIFGRLMATDTAAGVFAVDTIEPTAVLGGTPPPTTTDTCIYVSVGGEDVVYYKYKLDNQNYGSSFPVSSVIEITGLSAGSHTLSVIGRDTAGNWQTSPTGFSWTIISGGGGGGGGGGYYPPPVETDTSVLVESSFTSPDGTKITSRMTQKKAGETVTETSIEAYILPAADPADTQTITLFSAPFSAFPKVTLTIPPEVLRGIADAYGNGKKIKIIMTSRKADAQQRTETARNGKHLIGFDVFGITMTVAEKAPDDFGGNIAVTFDAGRIDTEKYGLSAYYYESARGVWLIAGDGGRTADAKHTVHIGHLTDFAVFREETTNAGNSQSGAAAIAANPADNRAAQYRQIEIDAAIVYASGADLTAIIAHNRTEKDAAAQSRSMEKYTRPLIADMDRVETKHLYALNNFIVYGTPATAILGAGERAGAVGSYKDAFGKLPKTENEWKDCLAISSGRWPGEKSPRAEAEAAKKFREIYLREPDMDHANDNAAVTVMAYGLRPADRNLNSENAAIGIFKGVFGYAPKSASDWDAARAIAYSGATR